MKQILIYSKGQLDDVIVGKLEAAGVVTVRLEKSDLPLAQLLPTEPVNGLDYKILFGAAMDALNSSSGEGAGNQRQRFVTNVAGLFSGTTVVR